MTRLGIESRTALLGAFLGLALLLGAGSAAAPAYAAAGEKDYKAGQKAEARKEYDEALLQYERALKTDPNNPQYLIATKRVRFQAGVMHVDRGHKLREQGNLREALAEYELASAIDPSSPVARQGIALTRSLLAQQQAPADPGAPPQDPPQEATPEQIPPPSEPAPPSGGAPAEEALGPPQLQPLSRAPINLRMTNDSKVVLETIGKLAGVNVLFDPDYVSKRITVELTNVTLEEALDQVALLTKTFWKAVTRNTILIIPDNAVKRREQEQQIIKTFYLSNTITPQELTEVVTAIRTLLETRRIQQINAMNAIIIRDTPDKVAIAEKIIRDVDKAKPEVVVDVAVLEVRRDKTRQLGLFPVSGGSPGIQIPAGFTPAGRTATTGTTTSSTSIPLSRLDNLSASDFSITLPGATLNALLSDSKTKVLQRPEVRASDGQKATLRIGDRIPIATGSFQPGIGGVGINPLVNTQFQYIDVGVNLDITPKVHTSREITMKVRVEISAVTSRVNIGGIEQPVIGQRVIEHDIRLREGEINVLGGILQTQTVQSVSGIPGLAQIPLLRYLFSNVSTTLAEDEVLIVLRPHVVRLPDITLLNQKALDVGTEGDIRLRTQRSLPETGPEEAPAAEPAPPGLPTARLRFQDSEVAPQADETFQIALEIENAQGAFSVPLEVAYDPGALKLVQVAKGSFLGQDSQPIAVVERTDEAGGKATVTLTRPPGSGAVSGGGGLTVFTFQAVKAGSTTLKVSSSGIRGPNQELLPLQGAEATLTIR